MGIWLVFIIEKMDMLTVEEQAILKSKKGKLEECKKGLKIYKITNKIKKGSVIIVEKLLIQLLLPTLI
jgi:hypothetical protein